MKIAVTYENGEVFQHFGRTQAFKVYDVQDGKIVASEVIGTDGQGHGALALVLQKHHIDALICGGLGFGAQMALQQAGIELCAGASGDTDTAVREFLAGNLVNTGSNCSHHHDEGESCGHCGHECH